MPSKKILFFENTSYKDEIKTVKTVEKIHPLREYYGSYFVSNEEKSSTKLPVELLPYPVYKIYSTKPEVDAGRPGIWWYPTNEVEPDLPKGRKARVERHGNFHTELNVIPVTSIVSSDSLDYDDYDITRDSKYDYKTQTETTQLELNIIGEFPGLAMARGNIHSVLKESGLIRMKRGSGFQDHTFEVDTAFSPKEINESNFGGTDPPYYYNIVPEYSFLIPGYEELITTKNYIHENLFPDVYTFLSELRSESRSTITADGPLIFPAAAGPAGSLSDLDEGDVGERPPKIGSPPPAPPKAPSGGRSSVTMPWYLTTPYNQLITLAGSIEGVFQDVLYDGEDAKVKRTNPKVGEEDKGQYYKKWTDAWTPTETAGPAAFLVNTAPSAQGFPAGVSPSDTSTAAGNVEFLIDKYKHNTFHSKELGALMKEATDKRNMFPMYVQITFPTTRNTSVASILSSTNTQGLFIKSLINETPKRITPLNYVQTTNLGNDSSNSSIDYHYHTPSLGPRPFPPIDYRVHDLKLDMFQSYFVPAVESDESNLVTYSAGDDQQQTMSLFSLLLSEPRIVRRIKQTYDSNRRSFFDIMRCKPAYTEVLAYKICKYEHDSQVLIAETYIPNDNSESLNIVNYIDTQVRYEKEYDYRIKLVLLVFGSAVSFETPPGTDIGDTIGIWETAIRSGGRSTGPTAESYRSSAKIEATIRPSLKVYEVPYEGGDPTFKTTVRVVDDPPSPPEVTFVPFKGDDRKILININNAFGEYWDYPVYIENGDEDIFRKIFIAQGNPDRAESDDKLNKIRFSGDDLADRFEVYRLTEQPYEFSDFKDNQLPASPLSTQASGNRSDSTAMIDMIEPNKKYYYIARTVDYHHKVSNPTAIYEVEMISNDGIIFPSIKTVGFATPGRKKKTARQMRRYIHIEPSMAHLQLSDRVRNEPNDKKAPQPQAGDVGAAMNPSIWGTDGEDRTGFKIRITSRSTGRKFDLNVVPNIKYTDENQ
jgi:hypothetical protein